MLVLLDRLVLEEFEVTLAGEEGYEGPPIDSLIPLRCLILPPVEIGGGGGVTGGGGGGNISPASGFIDCCR